ncbi:phytoene/squalene synthase family protein [Altererythrobacter sp. Root672]|uniref:phytoene/squalene synthase family protein n=1 Tax=Altererythrobacter sp. Root672 TaxID=1736584 RepID=UPI0006F8C6F1|nr:phytoene/squalene synthase family protein [Altererythrobacter sp. Root672]KRA79407.1 phytoene synthase [Altererythrobacter sp. Root672]
MVIRSFKDRRPRLLAPSRILRPPVRQVGGGREREELVDEARASIAKGSKSFALASRLFDRPTREKAWLLYAWCRRCDDIADGQEFGWRTNDEELAEHYIQALRILTRRALDGQPTADPAFDAFGQVALEARLTEQMANDVIAGFELDAEGWRPRTEGDLMRYCYHVAGAVGVMMANVMGVPDDDESMLDRACDLGLAFQLANIARDMSEDDAAGRCYLPVEWLVEADIPPGEHMKPKHREELVVLVSRLVDLAEQHETAARFGAAQLPFRQRWAVLSAANIYLAIARKVRARGVKAWDHRVTVSLLEKLGAVFRALSQAFSRPREPDEWPRWTRGEILVAVRMEGPIAPIPMTPLPDEES